MTRLAIICTECNRRTFDDPGWRCGEHPNKCVVQSNKPYMGVEMLTPEVPGLKLDIEVKPKAKK